MSVHNQSKKVFLSSGRRIGTLLSYLAVVGAMFCLCSISRTAFAVSPPDPTICYSGGTTDPGETSIVPGLWWNPKRYGTGWQFVYSQDRSSLQAYWFTFDRNNQPTWLTTDMHQVSATQNTWQATLKKYTWNSATSSAASTNVGSVAISFLTGDPTLIALSWQWNYDSSHTYSDTECVYDFWRGPGPQHVNGAYDGKWQEASGYGGEIVLSSINQDQTTNYYTEFHVIATFDVAGNPVFLTAQSAPTSTAPPPTSRAIDIYYGKTNPAFYTHGVPDQDCPRWANGAWVPPDAVNCMDPSVIPVAGSFSRTYSDSTHGAMDIDIDYTDPDPSSPPAQHVVWHRPPTGSGTVTIVKQDAYDQIVVNTTACVAPLGGSCSVVVNWAALPTHPTARAFRHDLDSDLRTPLTPNANVGEFTDSNIPIGARYQYELHSTNVETSTILAESAEFKAYASEPTGTPDTPPAPDASTAPTYPAESDTVGTTPGEFRVDNGGNATYGIPLFVPPGRGGVAPKFKLVYNSGGASDGYLGPGWGLSGVSSIMRCRKTPEAGDAGPYGPIQLDANDPYCLDGERLILVGGGSHGQVNARYRTEIDGFTEVIIEQTNPIVFAAYSKDGSVRHFGGSGATIGADAIGWNEYEFKDVVGNTITYAYAGTNALNERYLSTATYAGGSVTFNYIPRSEADHYVANKLAAWTQRLASVSVSSDTGPVRKYFLTYTAAVENANANLLTSVTECGGNPSTPLSGTCLNSTDFDWSGRSQAFQDTNPYGDGLDDLDAAKYGDVDGDGRADVVWLKNHTTLELSLTRASTTGGITFTGAVPVGSIPTSNSDARAWQLFDFNGDGRDDLLIANTTATPKHWEIRLSNGNGFDAPLPTDPTFPINDSYGLGTSSLLADFDGDGLIDVAVPTAIASDRAILTIYYMRRVSNPTSGHPYTFTSGTNVTIQRADGTTSCGEYSFVTSEVMHVDAVDVNGDGRADLVLKLVGNDQCRQGTSSGGPQYSFTSLTTPAIVLPPSNGGDQYWTILASVGDPAGAVFRTYSTWQATGSGAVVSDDDDKFRTVDVNGDGLADVVFKIANEDSWAFQLNTGNPAFGSSVAHFAPGRCVKSAGAGTSYPNCADIEHGERVQLLDYDGDGYLDFWEGRADSSVGDDNVAYFVYAWTGQGFSAASRLTPYMYPKDPAWGIVNFVDLDGDGRYDDFFAKPSTGHYGVRRETPRQPGKKIVTIYNGFGNPTHILYQPLTMASVYQRDYNGPYQTSWRGSPVFDVLFPTYVVSAVSTDSVGEGLSAPDAAVVTYRYQGLKAQTGGRGTLGFRRIISTDLNPSSLACELTGGCSAPSEVVETETVYETKFPLAGTPAHTYGRRLTQLAADPCADPDSTTCFRRAPVCSGTNYTITCDTAPSGATLMSQADDTWHWRMLGGTAVDPAPGLQLPIFLYRSATTKANYDLNTGSQTHTEAIQFTGYDSYGNLTGSNATTTIPGSTVVQQVTSTFTYDNFDNPSTQPATWILGRLRESDITTTRGKLSSTRTSTFDYDTTKYLLTVARVVGDSHQALNTFYSYDTYGNKIQVTTCSAGVIDSDCKATSASTIQFNPTDPYRIQRYTRYEYDTLNRYPIKVSEPFASSTGIVEKAVSSSSNFDVAGDPQRIVDANNVGVSALYGAMGRKYWEKSDTGSSTYIEYSWCGSAPCPGAAVYRMEARHSGAPTTWSYYDALAREVYTVRQGFAANQYIAVRHDYDLHSRISRVSEPYTTYAPSSGQVGWPNGESVYWTGTDYDVAGRPKKVTHPDGGAITVAYSGLVTTTTLPTNASGQIETRKETKNALGETISVENNPGVAGSLLVSYALDEYGKPLTVTATPSGGSAMLLSSMSYDLYGRQISLIDADKGSWTYKINALGEIVETSSGRSTCTSSFYDARGRVRQRIDYASATCSGTAEETSTWYYDTWSTSNAYGKLLRETSNQQGFFSRDYSYDSYTRPHIVTTAIGDGGYTYTNRTEYDKYSRPFQSFFDSSVNGYAEFGEQYHYNSQGYQDFVRNAANYGDPEYQQVYYTVQAMNARSQVTQSSRASNAQIATAQSYDAQTGRLIGINSGGGDLQNLTYGYDKLGNVTSRWDTTTGRSLQETYAYDNLQRLTTASLSVNGAAPYTALSMQYDALGNVKNKSDVGPSDYVYGTAQSACNQTGDDSIPGPHAVVAAGGAQYCYDANGNLTHSNSYGTRAVWYTAFDLPKEIQADLYGQGKHTEFIYGPNRERIRRKVWSGASGSTTVLGATHYVGNTEVAITYPDGVAAYATVRRYLGPVIVVQEKYIATGGLTQIHMQREYLFTDAQGSTNAVTDDFGDLVQNEAAMAFDPFGARRDPDTWATLSQAQAAAYPSPDITAHGFTSHEQVDDAGIIHMNGRIYDPHIGRFLQADPFVQSPDNPQSFNRYTYVFNNPLAYTDPTGYWGHRQQAYLRTLVAIAIAVYTGYYIDVYAVGSTEAALASAVGGFAAGAVQTGTLKGALTGAVSAELFWGIGTGFEDAGSWATSGGGFAGTSLNAAGWAAKTLAHGVAGGLVAELQGDKFGHGFVSAGVSEAFSGAVQRAPGGLAGRATAAAVLGGTASELSGGKFANGAVTGAFSYIFNSFIHEDLNAFNNGATDVKSNFVDMGAAARQEFQESGVVNTILGFIPGYDLYGCFQSQCSVAGWSLAALAAVPDVGKESSIVLSAGTKNFRLTQTVANHTADLVRKGPLEGELARPFLNSPLMVQEVMAAGRGIPDPGGAIGALRWDVPGTFRGTEGTWELVMKDDEILHFNFVGN